MYGMVNEAIRSMVVEKFNISIWEEITNEIGLSYKAFKPFEQYEDSVMGDLVAVISKKVKMEPVKLLELFGRYWINYARNSEYSSILDTFATSPIELIESLDGLHTRLQITFEDLKAPSFWVTHINDNEVHVHYRSERELPLEYFVIGLIHGIFDIFDKTCEVKIIPSPADEKAVFQVNF
jgi:hypothetical protein